MHLFNGFSEYTSKNDKYGITLPRDSSEEEKCLLVHCVLLMDYLLFENFWLHCTINLFAINQVVINQANKNK